MLHRSSIVSVIGVQHLDNVEEFRSFDKVRIFTQGYILLTIVWFEIVSPWYENICLFIYIVATREKESHRETIEP